MYLEIWDAQNMKLNKLLKLTDQINSIKAFMVISCNSNPMAHYQWMKSS